MKVLVTGAAGFIGSHLCEALVSQGAEVCGLDNFDPFYAREIKQGNLELLLKHERFRFVELDLVDQAATEELLRPGHFDVVVHLAAKAGVRPSLKAPLDYVDANVKATTALLEAMRLTGHDKFVQASSSSVYGRSAQVPFRESASLDSAISVYAATKQCCEAMSRMYHNLYGISCLNLRFFTVYGPRQRPDLAIHKFMRLIWEGRPIEVFGDGSMARDYTFVADTVQGILGSISRISSMSSVFETYNLGNSSPVPLNDLIADIERVLGKKATIMRKDVPEGDVPVTFADIEKAKEYLGYSPHFPLEKGLTIFKEWMFSRPS